MSILIQEKNLKKMNRLMKQKSGKPQTKKMRKNIIKKLKLTKKLKYLKKMKFQMIQTKIPKFPKKLKKLRKIN